MYEIGCKKINGAVPDPEKADGASADGNVRAGKESVLLTGTASLTRSSNNFGNIFLSCHSALNMFQAITWIF